LDQDKAFAAYALILIGAVGSLLTAMVLSGVTTAPSPLRFLEHLALGLAIRAAYKSAGGFSWADWSVRDEPAREAIAAKGFLPSAPANAQV
jgi:hypothetical protein